VIRILVALALVALFTARAYAAETAFYPLPAGSFPHDVAPALDGAVWYSDQGRGLLGRLDPTSGKVEEIPLGPNAAPHGVIVGPDGAAWITEGGQNAIARVDPATRKVTLFPLPKNFADANLNTATFDHQGKLWFTGQRGVHGRLDPATRKVDAWTSPRPGTYGITTTPAGEVWFASLAGDSIGQIDRASGAVTVVDPPRRGVGPRRIWSDSKGVEGLSHAQEHLRHLFGLCRRQGPRLGDRLAGQYDPALRSGERKLYRLSERQARRQCAPDAGPAGRGMGRGVGNQPPGGDQGLSGVTRRPQAAAALPFGCTSAV
jgi:streptogramin lyase